MTLNQRSERHNAASWRREDPMRADIVAGAVFPDYELTDHAGKRRTLSELQGPDPMILVLRRGGYCGFLADRGSKSFDKTCVWC